MRPQLIALLVMAGCGVASQPAQDPLASPMEAASVSPSPVVFESPGPAAVESTPPAAPEPSSAPQPAPSSAPFPQPPAVRILSGPYTIGPAPKLLAAAPDDVQREQIRWWATNYLEALTRYSADPSTDLWVVRGPYADVVKRAVTGGPRTYGLGSVTPERKFVKPWGSVSYYEVTLQYREDKAGVVTERAERLRLMDGGQMLFVIDGADANGKWRIGDAPRYATAEDIEREFHPQLGWMLVPETFVADEVPNEWTVRDNTPYQKWYADHIAQLNAAYNGGEFLSREFTDVTAKMLDFQPASFLGDGTFMVRLDGTVVTRSRDGVRLAPLSMTLKLFRTPLGGWDRVDRLLASGAWASGGDLALAQVDRPHG